MSSTAQPKPPPNKKEVVLGCMSFAIVLATIFYAKAVMRAAPVPFLLIVGLAMLGGLVARRSLLGKVAMLFGGLLVLSSLYVLVVNKILEPSDYVRIQPGMSFKEVEAILGGPPYVYFPPEPGSEEPGTEEPLAWVRDDGTVWVVFERGVVISKSFSKKRSHWFEKLLP